MTLLDSSEGLGIQSDGGLISISNYPESYVVTMNGVIHNDPPPNQKQT